MKIMIVTASPNKDGLTAACGEQASLGAAASGSEAVTIRLNDLAVGMCRACGDGWGDCAERHICRTTDDFQRIHALMKQMDGFVFITPVYWGDMSESAKAFIDRVRRCEALKKDSRYIAGKPIICVAAAGGSGNGCMTCLGTMERFVEHVRGDKFDFIGVTRKNREYKLRTIREAVRTMAESVGRS